MLWTAFREAYVTLDPDAFRDEVEGTWLLFRLPPGDLDETFTTQRRGAIGSRVGPEVVIKLAKRAGSNAFGNMVTVGRADNNDIVIEHASVSKFHAFFKHDGGIWTVRDAPSLNGTTVDGEAADRATPIHTGQVVAFGDVVEAVLVDAEALYSRLHQPA